MKEKLVEGLITRKILIFILVVIVFIAGGVAYDKMPKQHFPKVVLPGASVAVVYPGASAEDIEQLVCKKIEQECMKLNGFDKCETTANDNYAVVSVTLDMDLSQDEVDASFDDLKDKLDALKSELPSGVTSITVDDEIMDTAGLILAVTGDNITGDELLQRSNEISDELRQIDGVEKIDIHGDTPSEVKVTVNIDKLNDTNVSLAELAELISYHNSSLPTGDVTVDGNKINVNTSGQFESIDDIKGIVVSSNDDHIITRFGDIAEVRMAQPDDDGYFMYNKQRADVLAVYFREGLNVVSIGDEINKVIDDYNETLPDGIMINKVYMQPDDVQDSINDFLVNLLESIVLVVIVVMIGMNFRNAVVVSVAMPLAMFANFIADRYFGIEIHFVSLVSLIVVLGMLVDNSVVVSDAIQKNLDKGMDRKEAVIKGVSNVMIPVIVSCITTCVAFSSLLVFTGAYRQLAFPFAVTIICCLVASCIVSLMVTPLTSYFLLKKTNEKAAAKTPPSVRVYNKLSDFAFTHKKLTLLFSIIVVLAFGSSFFGLDMQVVPKAGKDILTVSVTNNKENDLRSTREIVDEIEAVLDEQPETKLYLSGVGVAIPRYDYSVLPKADSDEVGDIYIKVDLKEGNRFKKNEDLVDYLQQTLTERVGGAEIMVDELGIFATSTKPVEMKIYSDNTEDLNTAADLINSYMGQINGTKGINTKSEIATYDYYVNMDTTRMNTLGLMEAEAQNELSIAMQGRDVSTYRSGNKEYTVKLDANIDSKEAIQNFKVKSSVMGQKYNVGQFADVSLEPEITSISRLNGRRGRIVSCYTSDKVSDISVQTQLEKLIDENIDQFPESVTIEKSGKKKDFYGDVLTNIFMAGAVALFVMIVILVLQFGSFKKVAIIFISVPFGLTAGFLSLYLTGQPLSLFALIGAISLMGCVLANAIVLVDCINNERAEGQNVYDACRSAGGQRLRPIMMSTMTTVLGLLPLALFGDALFVPMAVLMLFGLFVSMIVNLVLVPLAYYVVYRKEDQTTA